MGCPPWRAPPRSPASPVGGWVGWSRLGGWGALGLGAPAGTPGSRTPRLSNDLLCTPTVHPPTFAPTLTLPHPHPPTLLSSPDRAFLDALATAAVGAMPQLPAADLCSLAESFSGEWVCVCAWEGGRGGAGSAGGEGGGAPRARARLPTDDCPPPPATHPPTTNSPTPDLCCYNIGFKDAVAEQVLKRCARAGAGGAWGASCCRLIISRTLALPSLPPSLAPTHPLPHPFTCPYLTHPSTHPPTPRPSIGPRLDEFSGDMLGHVLRSFGEMEYYDDELLEGGWVGGCVCVGGGGMECQPPTPPPPPPLTPPPPPCTMQGWWSMWPSTTTSSRQRTSRVRGSVCVCVCLGVGWGGVGEGRGGRAGRACLQPCACVRVLLAPHPHDAPPLTPSLTPPPRHPPQCTRTIQTWCGPSPSAASVTQTLCWWWSELQTPCCARQPPTGGRCACCPRPGHCTNPARLHFTHPHTPPTPTTFPPPTHPAQAIASILDAYSNVGCTEPEVVDQLVAKVCAPPPPLLAWFNLFFHHLFHPFFHHLLTAPEQQWELRQQRTPAPCTHHPTPCTHPPPHAGWGAPRGV